MRTTFGRIFCVLTLVLASAPLCSGAEKKVSIFAQRRSKEIFELTVALSQRLMGEVHYKKGLKLLDKAEGAEKAWLAACLAEYHRELRQKPIDGIKLLAPVVLPKNKAREWLTSLRTAEAKRNSEWEKAKALARRKRKGMPEPPTGLAVRFPTVTGDDLAHTDVPAALELARCLAKLGEIRSALRLVDENGKKFKGDHFLLVQSYETLADLHRTVRDYKRAKGGYGTALKIFGAVKAEAKRYKMPVSFSKWEVAVKKRIEIKLNEVNRLLAIEQFGPEYVLFKEAEEARLKRKDPIEAMRLHSQLMEKYPKTMLAASSRCMKIKCLLQHARLKPPAKGKNKTVNRLEKELKAVKDFYKLAVRIKTPPAELERVKRVQAQVVARIAEVKALPYSTAALKEAKALARIAVKDVWAPHNSEVLVDIAGHFFEWELDPDEAQKYYMQAWQWLQKVQKAEGALQAYKLPAKALKAAIPKQTILRKDFWGNVEKQDVGIGKVVNRKTAKWYLDSLRSQCVKALSFIHFHRKETKLADRWADLILTYDQKSREHGQKNEWNDSRRLKWGIKNGHLYAHKEELRNFTGRLRFAVLVADFYFCTERFSKSLAIADRLLAGQLGKLDEQQKSYLNFLAGTCVFWIDGSKRGFLRIEKAINKGNSTSYSSDRARFSCGNIANEANDKAIWRRGQNYFKQLISSRRNNRWVAMAHVTYGPQLVESGNHEDGIRILRSCPRKDKEIYGIAQWYIKQYETKGNQQ